LCCCCLLVFLFFCFFFFYILYYMTLLAVPARYDYMYYVALMMVSLSLLSAHKLMLCLRKGESIFLNFWDFFVSVFKNGNFLWKFLYPPLHVCYQIHSFSLPEGSLEGCWVDVQVQKSWKVHAFKISETFFGFENENFFDNLYLPLHGCYQPLDLSILTVSPWE